MLSLLSEIQKDKPEPLHQSKIKKSFSPPSSHPKLSQKTAKTVHHQSKSKIVVNHSSNNKKDKPTIVKKEDVEIYITKVPDEDHDDDHVKPVALAHHKKKTSSSPQG